LLMYGLFGAFLGGPELLVTYWPVILIFMGIRIMLRGAFPTTRVEASVDVEIEEDESDEEVL